MKPEKNHLNFDLTEPALVLSGGVNDLDWLVPGEQTVSKGQSIVFAITGRILYIEAPTGGTVHYNTTLKENLSFILEDPYGKSWMFKIKTVGAVDKEFEKFTAAGEYIQTLKTSEGAKNPEGLKGGDSGICKAVYTGIRDRKI